MTAAVAIAVALQIGCLGWAVARWYLDRRTLTRFVEACSQPQTKEQVASPRRSAARMLPRFAREAGVEVERAIRGPRNVDVALTEAFGRLIRQRLGASLALAIGLDVVLIAAALEPACAALLGSAGRIGELWANAQTLDQSRLYAAGLQVIPQAFLGLREAFAASAALVGGLLAVWGVRWWLLRPEARELRAVHAFLRATASSGKELNLPSASRIVHAVAPSSSLGSAFGASIAFVIAAGVAASSLAWASDIRRHNAVEMVFTRWPERVLSAEGVRLPSHAAGEPLPAGPTLLLGDSVQLGTLTLATLSQGVLPAEWRTGLIKAKEVVDAFAAAGGKAEILVLADRATPLSTAREVLRYLRDDYQASRVAMVLDRKHALTGRQVWAALRVSLGPPPAMPAAKLKVSAERVAIASDEGVELPFSLGDWRARLQRDIRERTGLYRPGEEPPNLWLEVEVEGDLTFDRWVEVLAAADSVCDPGVECGLPGLGLRYSFIP